MGSSPSTALKIEQVLVKGTMLAGTRSSIAHAGWILSSPSHADNKEMQGRATPLALKPRVDITRSLNRGVRRPTLGLEVKSHQALGVNRP